MPDITFSITDVQKKALDNVIAGGLSGISSWAENFTSVRATKAQNIIINELVKHCNENGIAIATGVEAQVEQAYTLDVVKTADVRNSQTTTGALE